jgi:hypothetical protein
MKKQFVKPVTTVRPVTLVQRICQVSSESYHAKTGIGFDADSD